MTTTFGAGVNFYQLMKAAAKEGVALQNMPSLPHVTLIGAAMTATHGSGHNNPIITKNIVGMDFIHADGTMKSYESTDPDFDHYLLNFGTLGIVTSVTMKVLPYFDVAKGIYQNLPFETLFANFDKMMHHSDFFSLFTDWKKPRCHQIWIG